jgi:hypothetical protein
MASKSKATLTHIANEPREIIIKLRHRLKATSHVSQNGNRPMSVQQLAANKDPVLTHPPLQKRCIYFRFQKPLNQQPIRIQHQATLDYQKRIIYFRPPFCFVSDPLSFPHCFSRPPPRRTRGTATTPRRLQVRPRGPTFHQLQHGHNRDKSQVM